MQHRNLSELWATSEYDGLMIDEAMAKLVSESPLMKAVPPYAWNKWECRSGLQKNIRRGRTQEALCCAHRLAEIDARYCWYSFHIIAMEDVGDPWVVLWTRQILSGIQPALKKVDGMQALYAIVARMCKAPKTRAYCEISAAMGGI